MASVLSKFFVVLIISILQVAISSEAVRAQGSAAPQGKSSPGAAGYVFETNHDDIVARAKKEGKLRFLTTWDSKVMEQMNKAFRKKYPFIDVTVGEHGSVEAA